MSSYPQHKENMLELQKLGMYVEDEYNWNDDGFFCSWDQDSLVYIVEECVAYIKKLKEDPHRHF